ncbi:MAG: glycosyltransferase family 4 protein [Pseudoxanthomonas sp.]
MTGTALLAWAARTYARRRGLVDVPSERRSHALPTPRGGGVAIVATVVLAIAWLGWRQPGQAPALAAFAAGLLLVAGVGVWDDHRPLPVWPRLLAHLAAAACLVLALHLQGMHGWRLPLAFLFAVGLVNVWNFMDGIDGLATSQALIAAGAYAWLLWPAGAGWLALVLAASCLGFLPFNFPRARIFLGDVGSGALGYTLAGLAVCASTGGSSPVVALSPLLLFLVDASFTLVRRVLRGERWWTPHVTHAYQILAQRYGHAAVTGACALASSLATILACTVPAGRPLLGVLLAVVVIAPLACAWWVIAGNRGG